jgi:hypothetical protein
LGVQLGGWRGGHCQAQCPEFRIRAVALAETSQTRLRGPCRVHAATGEYLSGSATVGAVFVRRWHRLAFWLGKRKGHALLADIHFQFVAKYPNSWRCLYTDADFVLTYRDDSQYDVIT